MIKPTVSIILATCNRAHLISQAIQSVLSQTVQDWELIIIDDASEDKTQETLKSWQEKDKRIICLKNEENSGIAATSNKGLKIAKGKYIAIIDDDDYWAFNDKLEKQIDFLEKNPDYVGTGGGLIIINEKGKEIRRILKPASDQLIKEKALFVNPMANSTTVFCKETAEKIGFYNEQFRFAADWDFWLKMGKQGKLFNFQEYFTYYLMGKQNTCFQKQREHLKNCLKIVKRHKNDYPHFKKAIIFVLGQFLYAFLPFWLRQKINPFLSLVKKSI